MGLCAHFLWNEQSGVEKMQTEQQLRASLAPVFEKMGLEYVGSQFFTENGQRSLRIFIDCEGGVSSDDCAKAIRQAQAVLSVDDSGFGDYSLEVSSPGLDRLLFSTHDFDRYKGREAKVWLRQAWDGRRRFTGTIQAVDVQANAITFMVNGMGEFQCTYEDMEKARLVPNI